MHKDTHIQRNRGIQTGKLANMQTNEQELNKQANKESKHMYSQQESERRRKQTNK